MIESSGKIVFTGPAMLSVEHILLEYLALKAEKLPENRFHTNVINGVNLSFNVTLFPTGTPHLI